MMYSTKLHKKKKRNRRKRFSVPLCDNCQWKEVCVDGPKSNCKSYLAEINTSLTKINKPTIEQTPVINSIKAETEKINKQSKIMEIIFWTVFVICVLFLLIE